MKTFVIAEAGVNHNGNLRLAYKLVDAAKKAKADCVKFQWFHSKELTTIYASQTDYQIKNTKKTRKDIDESIGNDIVNSKLHALSLLDF